MHRCIVPCCFVILLFLAPCRISATEIPDSPVGKQLQWAIEALSGRDGTDPTPRFDPEFIKMLPASLPEPRAATAIFAARQSIFQFGEARLLGIRDGHTDFALTADVEAAKTGSRYRLHLSVSEASGLIDGMLIAFDSASVLPELADWQGIHKEITTLPGEVSVLVAEVDPAGFANFGPVYSVNPDLRLGIGSAFKLWVLGALAELVHEGHAKWDDLLPLDPDLKTMPIGALQIEAQQKGLGDRAEFPLSRYAAEMISISDNPASDHLIHFVGRHRIEQFVSRSHSDPDLNRPFLTTGELFKLKRGAPVELLQAYCAALTPAERQAILDSDAFRNSEISIPLAIAWPTEGPIAINCVEWFASARELVRTMLDLRQMEELDGMQPLARALRINDGINLDDEIWPSVSYKGGSEPGVINLTFLVQHRSGQWWAVSLGWNNTEAVLNDDQAIHIAIAIFAQLDKGNKPDPSLTPSEE